MRQDDPQGVMRFKDRYFGGTALIVLGGPSGERWERIRDKVNPDVVLAANGNTNIGADFWMLTENMNYQYQEMLKGTADQKERGREFMGMLTKDNDAKVKFISYLSWNLLDTLGIDKSNCVCIKRIADPNVYELPDDFSLREYGDGFLSGPEFARKECVKPSIRFPIGTVAASLLHMAGILGCFEVHTIGMDFHFTDGSQHWYEHPDWKVDRFRTEAMFTTYKGLKTMWEWVDAAEWLDSLEWLFETQGLVWKDRSNGLLQAMGVWSAS